MTDLSEKMRTRADVDNLEDTHALRMLATEFDDATERFYGTPQTCTVKAFMGTWARARRCWCDYTGEDLV